ncbi:MAG: hypothetical protein OXC30_05945 [Alphaproteobacteria bacterium]|nr:hypothetical protein [Alphaproteobacteria bacterium]
MFDVSLLISFGIFMIFVVVKVRPAVVAMLDEAALAIKEDFDNADTALKQANETLQMLHERMEVVLQRSEESMQEAGQEVTAIQKQTQTLTQARSHSYQELCTQQEAHWAQQLESYQLNLCMEHISSAIDAYVGAAKHQKKMSDLTNVIVKNYIKEHQKG